MLFDGGMMGNSVFVYLYIGILVCVGGVFWVLHEGIME